MDKRILHNITAHEPLAFFPRTLGSVDLKVLLFSLLPTPSPRHNKFVAETEVDTVIWLCSAFCTTQKTDEKGGVSVGGDVTLTLSTREGEFHSSWTLFP